MNLRKISDIAKSEQTDALKQQVFNLVRQFVYKNRVHYHPHYQGDVNDLISDIYADIMTPKARHGEKESLLDKFNPEITNLPYLVKQVVIRKLIDRERTFKPLKTYGNERNEETGDVSLDYLANKVDETPNTEQISLTESELEAVRNKFSSLSSREKTSFMKEFKAALPVLSNSSKEMFKEILGDWFPDESSISEDSNSTDNIQNVVLEYKDEFSDSPVSISIVNSSKEGPVIKLVSSEGTVDSSLGSDSEDVYAFFRSRGYVPFIRRGKQVYFKNS